jgi:hypothetical protein
MTGASSDSQSTFELAATLFATKPGASLVRLETVFWFFAFVWPDAGAGKEAWL